MATPSIQRCCGTVLDRDLTFAARDPAPHKSGARKAGSIALCLASVIVAISATGVRAQSVTDGTEVRVGPEITRALLARIGQTLRSPDAKVTALHEGRQNAVCGAVEVRNRMGTYTGARPFVFEPDTGFLGRLPEGPELRNPASVADYTAMERVRTLFTLNCAER